MIKKRKKKLLDRPALIFPRILTSFVRRVMITIRPFPNKEERTHGQSQTNN